MNHPVAMSPLSKEHGNTGKSERFELFVNGVELVNAYTEQNDPVVHGCSLYSAVETGKELHNSRKTARIRRLRDSSNGCYLHQCMAFKGASYLGIGIWSASNDRLGNGCRSSCYDDDEPVEHSRCRFISRS